SDTVYLIMEGSGYVEYEVAGWDWTGNISSAGSSYFSSICTGNDGSFYLLGHFGGGLKVEDTEVFSSVVDDIFIVKYAENGDYQWSKFISSTSHKGKGDLAVDSEGNVFVSGSYRESIQIEDSTLTTDMGTGSGYLVKYDPLGKLLWIKELETTRGVMCDNIEIDSSDHIYLGGNFSGSLTIDNVEVNGSWDIYANVMFVARMDTAGSCQWISHAVTDPYMDLFGLIDMDMSASGQLVTAGTYTDQADFGNGVVLSTPVEAPFLVQFDEDGEAQWGSTISTEFGFAEAFDVSTDDQGRIFMTGMHLGDIGFGDFMVQNEGMVMEEIFLARFDSAGVCTALNSYGSQGEGGDFGVSYEPATDTSGYLLGMFGDTLIMGPDTLLATPASGAGGVSPNMFIAKLTDDGEPLAMKSAGVRGNQFFGEIQVTEEGRLYFAGLNEGISVKKGSASASPTVAFVGFLEQGIAERMVPVEVYVNSQETICLGDSILFRGLWCSEAGIYTDRINGSEGIDSIFTLELITEICTSFGEDPGMEDYMIYPNPVSQVLYVNSPDQEPFEVQIFGLSGKLIWQNREQSEYRIDVQDYQTGFYFLKLIRRGQTSVFKVIVE
ncbi:MAG: T9SS type A sorting domain-containing protein, partial [Bacteroidota bacterium]